MQWVTFLPHHFLPNFCVHLEPKYLKTQSISVFEVSILRRLQIIFLREAYEDENQII